MGPKQTQKAFAQQSKALVKPKDNIQNGKKYLQAMQLTRD